jgi:hypothetical protein
MVEGEGMSETWKREIDKVYMSDVVCLDKETVEKIEDGHRMGVIFSRNPSEGSVVFHSESVVKDLKWEVTQKDTEIHRLKAERDEIYGLLGSAHLELRQNLEYGYNRNTIKSTLISVGQYAPKLKAKMDELQAKMGDKL